MQSYKRLNYEKNELISPKQLVFLMINIGLQHFRMVHTIVKEGTLTKAAEALHLTQSALSHQLRELEKELEVPVFYRKGKRMQLSDEGARFLQSAEKILAEIHGLEQDIKNLKQGKTGKINISTQCYTAYHWLPAILKYFKSKCPDIVINIASEATFTPWDYLINGELDIGIVKSKIDHPDVAYEPIFEDQLFAILHKDHPLAHKACLEIADFEGEEIFLAWSDPATGNIPIIEQLIDAQQVQPKNIHHIHFTDAIIEMVDSGIGVSVLANWIVQPYLETKDIVAVPLPPEVANRTWYAATSRQNPAIRTFLECLKYHFSEMDMKRTNPVKKIVMAV
jgi:LysR family transcriptional regulator for metE and metH